MTGTRSSGDYCGSDLGAAVIARLLPGGPTTAAGTEKPSLQLLIRSERRLCRLRLATLCTHPHATRHSWLRAAVPDVPRLCCAGSPADCSQPAAHWRPSRSVRSRSRAGRSETLARSTRPRPAARPGATLCTLAPARWPPRLTRRSRLARRPVAHARALARRKVAARPRSARPALGTLARCPPAETGKQLEEHCNDEQRDIRARNSDEHFASPPHPSRARGRDRQPSHGDWAATSRHGLQGRSMLILTPSRSTVEPPQNAVRSTKRAPWWACCSRCVQHACTGLGVKIPPHGTGERRCC